jgi:HEAT repeat protein
MKRPKFILVAAAAVVVMATSLLYFKTRRSGHAENPGSLSEQRDLSKVRCEALSYNYSEKIYAYDPQMKQDVDLPEIRFEIHVQDMKTKDGIAALYLLKNEYLSYYALVGYDSFGRIKSINLPEKLDYGTFRLFIATLTNFQHPGFKQEHLRAAVQASPLLETNNDGVMQVTWEQKGSRFSRKGERFVTLFDLGRGLKIQNSELELSFDRDSDFPSAISYEEALSYELAKDIAYDGRRSVSVIFDRVLEPIATCDEINQNQFMASMRLVPYALDWRDQVSTIMSHSNVDVDKELKQVEDQIARTRSSMDPSLDKTFALLMYYFRGHPEAIARLSEKLKAQGSGEFANFLIDLLGSIGNKEAQAVLLPYLTESRDEQLQRRAIFAHMQIKEPELENVSTLRDVYLDKNASEPVKQAAVLTMASCAEKLPDSDSKPYLDLLKAESATQDPKQLHVILAALGNYGKDEAIDALVPFVGAMEEQVSIQAISALAGINSRRAADTLLGNALTPQSRSLERQAAVQSLQKSAYQLQNDESFFKDLWQGYRSIRGLPENDDLGRAFLNLLLQRGYNPNNLSAPEVKGHLIKALGGSAGLKPYEKDLLENGGVSTP